MHKNIGDSRVGEPDCILYLMGNPMTLPDRQVSIDDYV